MESAFPRHFHVSAHDWGQVLMFQGKIGQGFRSFTTYAIKTVSERLGIRPAAVRQAYERLDALGGVHILARQFPGGRQQRQLPLDTTGAGES